MVKTLFNIGIINDQTNYIKLAIELGIFILIVAIIAVFIYKKTKRTKTVVISILYLLAILVNIFDGF